MPYTISLTRATIQFPHNNHNHHHHHHPRAPYINVLPSSQEVNPTLIWSDEDLALLDNSPLVAATRSLRKKLEVGVPVCALVLCVLSPRRRPSPSQSNYA